MLITMDLTSAFLLNLPRRKITVLALPWTFVWDFVVVFDDRDRQSRHFPIPDRLVTNSSSPLSEAPFWARASSTANTTSSNTVITQNGGTGAIVILDF
jgi:hypothetical protein